MIMADRLWVNARLATMAGQPADPIGLINDGIVATRDGRIVWCGPRDQLPSAMVPGEVTDCGGRLITPGLIDCHTHLVHAGNRAHEFELRLKGATYEEVARAGGGIVSSVKALRAATETELTAQSLPRLDALIAEGVTTIEIKSGYGLDTESEMKTLRVARQLGEIRPVTVRTTFLGAHALPPEAQGDRAAYVDKVINEMLPAVAASGLADAVDAFCEKIAFQPDEVDRIFTAARKLGLPVKLHADQLSDLDGAELAARHRALSADHLEYTSESGAAAMARAGTVAVILPGAFYFIRETKKPPIETFRSAGVAMALATDNNPGTSPLTSLLLTMNMGATLFRMTVEECLLGVTRHAATALGLGSETGTIETGKWADLAIWDVERPAELVYRMGFNPLFNRIHHGRPDPVASHGA